MGKKADCPPFPLSCHLEARGTLAEVALALKLVNDPSPSCCLGWKAHLAGGAE